MWALAFSQVSHILLVINSSTNCLVYCLLSSRFREEAKKKLRGMVACCARMTTSNSWSSRTMVTLVPRDNNKNGIRESPLVEQGHVTPADVEAANQEAENLVPIDQQVVLVNADIHAQSAVGETKNDQKTRARVTQL